MSNSKETYYGEVIFFDNRRGYGFLSWEKDGVKQGDSFVHYSDLLIEGYKTLHKGQKVSFKLGVNKSGIPKAIEVQVLSN